MSTKHRKLRQEATARQQVAKHCLRNLASLRATRKGPYAPGPWWPVGEARYQGVEEWEKMSPKKQAECSDCHGSGEVEVEWYDGWGARWRPCPRCYEEPVADTAAQSSTPPPPTSPPE